MSLIKKDDLVEVITGPYKGQRGKVLEVLKKQDQLIIEGINKRIKHQKVQMTEAGQTGGITEMEAPIHASNVMFVDPESSKPVRLGTKMNDDGTKVRVTKGRNASGAVAE